MQLQVWNYPQTVQHPGAHRTAGKLTNVAQGEEHAPEDNMLLAAIAAMQEGSAGSLALAGLQYQCRSLIHGGQPDLACWLVLALLFSGHPPAYLASRNPADLLEWAMTAPVPSTGLRLTDTHLSRLLELWPSDRESSAKVRRVRALLTGWFGARFASGIASGEAERTRKRARNEPADLVARHCRILGSGKPADRAGGPMSFPQFIPIPPHAAMAHEHALAHEFPYPSNPVAHRRVDELALAGNAHGHEDDVLLAAVHAMDPDSAGHQALAAFRTRDDMGAGIGSLERQDRANVLRPGLAGSPGQTSSHSLRT